MVTVPRSIPAAPVATIRRRPITSQSVGQAVLHLILLAFAFASVAPFVWMLFGSFKNFRELVSSTDLLPHAWTLSNYTEIINRVNFLSAMRNSVLVGVSQTLAVMLASFLCGYVFSKVRFCGN